MGAKVNEFAFEKFRKKLLAIGYSTLIETIGLFVLKYLWHVKNLYIIAGPIGAGKTTASYTILPDVLECDEYVNDQDTMEKLETVSDKILKSFPLIQKRLIEFKRYKNSKIVISKDGEIVKLTPDEYEVLISKKDN